MVVQFSFKHNLIALRTILFIPVSIKDVSQDRDFARHIATLTVVLDRWCVGEPWMVSGAVRIPINCDCIGVRSTQVIEVWVRTIAILHTHIVKEVHFTLLCRSYLAPGILNDKVVGLGESSAKPNRRPIPVSIHLGSHAWVN
jgi:hypothetical protein